MQRWSPSTLPTSWPWPAAERKGGKAVQAERLAQTATAIESCISESLSAAGSTDCSSGRASPFIGVAGAAARSAGRKENRQADIQPDITGRIAVHESNIWPLSAFFRSILSDKI